MATAELAPAAPPAKPAEGVLAKIDFRQIYFNAVLGAIGGLLGWAAVALMGSLFELENLNIYVRNALILGPLPGVCIGFAIGSTEGLIASRSLRRLLRGGMVGAGLGAVGGLVGLVVGEFIFSLAGSGVWPRALGWAVFGMLVGASDGFAQRMPAKIRYGLLGGLLGGLVGGSTFELLRVLLGMGTNRAAGLAWGSAIGLIILGACIGALVGLVESLLRQSFLFFITGRLEGQTRTLDSSRPHTLGSDTSATVVLPNDPTVEPIHAEVTWNENGFSVAPREGTVIVKREGREKTLTNPLLLKPGDRIQLGATKMVYRGEEAPKKKLPAASGQ